MKPFALHKVSIVPLLLLLLPLLLHQCAAQQFPGGMPGGGPKHCPAYNKCSKNEEMVPKWPLKLTSTGCTKIGGGLAMSSSGKFDDTIIVPCCDQWNACVQICGSARSYCDTTIKKCFDTQCKSLKDKEQIELCESNASTKVLMLNLSDCRSFEKGQQDHCECMTKDKVAERRKTILEKFYKKYSPNDVSKATNLAAKATDAKKFAGLISKLIMKYPKAVTRMKDPGEEYMENMMKRQRSGEFDKAKKAADSAKEEDDEEEEDEGEKIEL
jgi:hypothetical protein